MVSAPGGATLWDVLALDAPDGSRLGDDLYSLYLAAIAWVVIPMYASAVAQVLPSDIADFSRLVDVASALALVAPIWFGYRGGPFLVNRAVVLHELGSPLDPRGVLAPRLARQAVAYAALAGLAANALTAMGDPEEFGYRLAARNSFVAALAVLAAVLQTPGWLVAWKTRRAGTSPAGRARPWPAVAANVAGTAAVGAVVAADRSLSSAVGLAALAAALVLGAASAWSVLSRVPIPHLWRRATALDEMRSAALSFDFQRVLVSLRRAVDQTEAHRSPVRLARRWMPRALWRYLASVERGWNTRLGQVVAGAVAAALVVRADPANGVVALALAATGMIVGFELASPIASTAGQIWFGVHYPRGSGPVLRGQVATAAVIALVISAAALGWVAGTEPAGTALASAGLFAFGTLAAAVQGRLGSPDLAWLSDKLGTMVAPALWIRALAGPILCLALTVVVSHGWLRPDGYTPWPALTLAVVAAAVVVACYPLEKTLP